MKIYHSVENVGMFNIEDLNKEREIYKDHVKHFQDKIDDVDIKLKNLKTSTDGK